VKKFFVFFIGIALVYACTNNNKTQNETQQATPEVVKKDSIITPSDSGIVNLDLTDGVGKISIRKKADQTVYIQFTSVGYNKISAKLSSPDSLANIRFSQIFLPDGTMDGPFGSDMEYTLPTDGVYKISVHENMMAGDPWQGVFNVYVELSHNKNSTPR